MVVFCVQQQPLPANRWKMAPRKNEVIWRQRGGKNEGQLLARPTVTEIFTLVESKQRSSCLPKRSQSTPPLCVRGASPWHVGWTIVGREGWRYMPVSRVGANRL